MSMSYTAELRAGHRGFTSVGSGENDNSEGKGGLPGVSGVHLLT